MKKLQPQPLERIRRKPSCRTIRRWVYATLAAALGVVTGLGGPGNTEAILFPMKYNYDFRLVPTKDDTKVCFEFDVKILREGKIVFKSWMLQTKEVIPHRFPINPSYMYPGSKKLEKGQRGVVTVCADKPKGAYGKEYIVYGYVYYRTWHNLWDVPWHICEEHKYG